MSKLWDIGGRTKRKKKEYSQRQASGGYPHKDSI